MSIPILSGSIAVLSVYAEIVRPNDDDISFVPVSGNMFITANQAVNIDTAQWMDNETHSNNTTLDAIGNVMCSDQADGTALRLSLQATQPASQPAKQQ